MKSSRIFCGKSLNFPTARQGLAHKYKFSDRFSCEIYTRTLKKNSFLFALNKTTFRFVVGYTLALFRIRKRGAKILKSAANVSAINTYLRGLAFFLRILYFGILVHFWSFFQAGSSSLWVRSRGKSKIMAHLVWHVI